MGIPFYHTYQSQKGGIKEKMNTIRKLKKNAKALSPVVASIILIAVTVAVSIAVAAWMGALVVGNMNTEEVKITNVYFATASPFNATLTVKNTGSSAVVLADAYIGTQTATSDLGAGKTIQPNNVLSVEIAPPTGGFAAGQSYQFKLVSTKGNAFVYTATAPL
jgi:flagellin-like protein